MDYPILAKYVFFMMTNSADPNVSYHLDPHSVCMLLSHLTLYVMRTLAISEDPDEMPHNAVC